MALRIGIFTKAKSGCCLSASFITDSFIVLSGGINVFMA